MKLRFVYNRPQYECQERQKEIDYAIEKNLLHKWDNVVFLSEDRPTFYDFLLQTEEGYITCFGNADIEVTKYAFENLHKIKEKEIWAVGRYEISEDGTKINTFRVDSQDFWIIPNKYLPDDEYKFNFGLLGSDNKIAFLFNKNGYDVSNPMEFIILNHIHKSGIRTYTQNDRLKGDYKIVNKTKL